MLLLYCWSCYYFLEVCVYDFLYAFLKFAFARKHSNWYRVLIVALLYDQRSHFFLGAGTMNHVAERIKCCRARMCLMTGFLELCSLPVNALNLAVNLLFCKFYGFLVRVFSSEGFCVHFAFCVCYLIKHNLFLLLTTRLYPTEFSRRRESALCLAHVGSGYEGP